MVALDAAVANLVEKGDRVLSISSGFYGDGLREFAVNYGGDATLLRSEDGDIVEPADIERQLEKDPQIKVATFVHVETPCGTLGPLAEVGKICDDHGVILIADTITSVGGVPVNADRNHVDVVLGASQKCFSAPPGLAMISVSPRAWEKIERRKEKVPSFYLDLLPWKNMWLKKREFPYTQSVSDIFALNAGLDLILKEGLNRVYARHRKVADFVRDSCRDIGLEIFAKRREISSKTVTAVKVPAGIDEKQLRMVMAKRHGVIISHSWGKTAGKVVLLGHTGYNAQEKKARIAMSALSKSLKSLGFKK